MTYVSAAALPNALLQPPEMAMSHIGGNAGDGGDGGDGGDCGGEGAMGDGGGGAAPQPTATCATAASPDHPLPHVYSKANDGE